MSRGNLQMIPEDEELDLETTSSPIGNVLKAGRMAADVLEVPAAVYVATRPGMPKAVSYTAWGYVAVKAAPWAGKVRDGLRRFLGR